MVTHIKLLSFMWAIACLSPAAKNINDIFRIKLIKYNQAILKGNDMEFNTNILICIIFVLQCFKRYF